MGIMAKSPKRHGLITRPIVRDRWSADIDASRVFAMNQANKLSIGLQQFRRRFGGASAGDNITGPLGGGSYVPIQAPSNPGNQGSA